MCFSAQIFSGRKMSQNQNFAFSEQPSTPGLTQKFTLMARAEVEINKRVLLACIEIERQHLQRHQEILENLEQKLSELRAEQFVYDCVN